MAPTDRRKVGIASKLLAKAESTDSESEAIALALRAYSLTADWLNTCEGNTSSLRRRERRLLRDRRGYRRSWRSFVPGGSAGRVASSAAGIEPPPARRIDLRA